MTTCVALLRGINVGRAKRLGMAELRELVESLGHTNVRTLLNSGNVVFDAKRSSLPAIARSLEAAIETGFGFAAPVIVVTAAEVDAIVNANPLPRAPDQPSRYLVAFLPNAATLVLARPLLAEAWAPEALAVHARAAYLWCHDGIIASRLLQAFERATGGVATTRNWATVLKLQAASAGGPAA